MRQALNYVENELDALSWLAGICPNIWGCVVAAKKPVFPLHQWHTFAILL